MKCTKLHIYLLVSSVCAVLITGVWFFRCRVAMLLFRGRWLCSVRAFFGPIPFFIFAPYPLTHGAVSQVVEVELSQRNRTPLQEQAAS